MVKNHYVVQHYNKNAFSRKIQLLVYVFVRARAGACLRKVKQFIRKYFEAVPEHLRLPPSMLQSIKVTFDRV